MTSEFEKRGSGLYVYEETYSNSTFSDPEEVLAMRDAIAFMAGDELGQEVRVKIVYLEYDVQFKVYIK